MVWSTLLCCGIQGTSTAGAEGMEFQQEGGIRDNKKDNHSLQDNKSNWLLINYQVNGEEESIDYMVLENK